MKRFINSLWVIGLAVVWIGGCSSKKEELDVVIVPDTPVVEAPRSAPTTPTLEPPIQTPTPETVKAPVSTPAAVKYTQAELAARLKEWDQKLRFLTTSFTQTTEFDGVPVTHSQGTLFYDKQHQLLRLDTLGADGALQQSAVTNKREIIILDETGKQVTTSSWQQWQQGQTNQALFDFGNYTALLDRHHIQLIRDYQLALTPKEGELYTLYVTVSPTDFFPTQLTIEADSLITKTQLIKTQKNKPLDTAIFGGFFK